MAQNVERKGFVSSLSDDIMWSIFTMNAIVSRFSVYQLRHSTAPLVVVRSCSHVCARWRRIIMDSPSLWARAVHFNVLSELKSCWQEEIMRRAGRGPLSIDARVRRSNDLKYHEKKALLCTILKDHWDQLEYLAISVDNVRDLGNASWANLLRPAPNLRGLDIECSSSPFGPGEKLFGDYAPSLESMVLRSFGFKITPRTPWITKITTLDVSDEMTMSIAEWMEGLEHMPLLRSLTLRNYSAAWPPSTSLVKRVQLRYLQLIDLHCLTQMWPVFLDQITPGVGCRFHVQSYSRTQASTEEMSLIKKTLSRYSRNVIAGRTVVYMELRVSPNYLQLKGGMSGMDGIFPMWVSISGIRLPELLEPFYGCDFSKIARLEIGHTDKHPSDPACQAALLLFFSAFNSLQELQTNLTYICDIHYSANNHHSTGGEGALTEAVVFPKLRKLEIVRGNSYENPETLMSFLSTRKDQGVPITVLDISYWQKLVDPKEFDNFDEMLVLYRVRNQSVYQHVCGGGNGLKDTYVKPWSSLQF
ncbi:hypothetical protein CVT26_005543 [Gymnopilus dilepis]|uniref:Uncharacterized protein n=1 Tax=Gymnopilus dilepis TaxID=231916 RepID=A0A409X2V9_9AGAR|nr:hypothetical protein CVT26_005543 [Gymnopilus dilepis]